MEAGEKSSGSPSGFLEGPASGSDAVVEALKTSKLWRGVEEPTVLYAAREAKIQRCREGKALFVQGDEALGAHLVWKGKLRLDQSDAQGRNIVLRFIEPGSMAGTLAALQGKPLPATATAVENTTLIYWPKETFEALMFEDNRLAINVVDFATGRIMDLQSRLRQAASQKVEQRLASMLLRLFRESGQPLEAGLEVDLCFSRQDLAEMSATSIYTVSRILNVWEKDGVLKAKRSRNVVLLRPKALLASAEE